MNTNTRYFDGTLPFRVVPMRPNRVESALKLQSALVSGLTAVRDPERPDFYAVLIDGVAYYFHVFEPSGTAYLVATSERHRDEAAISDHRISAPEHATTH